MKAWIHKIKYSLSHIKEASWHWRITEAIWGKNAHGKTCEYYWIKFPFALVAHAIIVVIAVIIIICRMVWVALAWFFGYQYLESWKTLLNPNANSANPYYYTPYKHKSNGTKYKIAPWEICVVAALIYLLKFYPSLMLSYATGVGIGLVCLLIMYGLTRFWKAKPISDSRQKVVEAWHQICPPLEVEEEIRETSEV